MPTNRTRRPRTWQPHLDDYKRQQLLGGPNAALLAGVGYLNRVEKKVGRFEDMSPELQAQTLAEMEADWRQHREELMTWWNAGEDAPRFSSKPWIFPRIGTAGALPWAAEQFDSEGTKHADK